MRSFLNNNRRLAVSSKPVWAREQDTVSKEKLKEHAWWSTCTKTHKAVTEQKRKKRRKRKFELKCAKGGEEQILKVQTTMRGYFLPTQGAKNLETDRTKRWANSYLHKCLHARESATPYLGIYSRKMKMEVSARLAHESTMSFPESSRSGLEWSLYPRMLLSKVTELGGWNLNVSIKNF